MRIVVIAGWSPDPYGEANYATQVFTAYRARFPDDQVVVFAHPGGPRRVVRDGIEILRPPAWLSGRIGRTIYALLLAILVPLRRPNAVHLQGTHTPLYGGLVGEALLVMQAVCRLLGHRMIYTLHSTWTREHLQEFFAARLPHRLLVRLAVWYYGLTMRLACHLSTHFSILTAGEACPIIDTFITDHRINRRRVVHENHGTRRPMGDPDAATTATQNRSIRVACLGFIRSDKNYLPVIDAFCAATAALGNRPTVLIIAGEPRGDGAAYLELLRHAATTSAYPDRIHLEPVYLSDSDYLAHIASTDIMVVPYARVIGASGPIHHALSHGVTVLAANIGYNSGLGNAVCLYDGSGRALHAALLHVMTDHILRTQLRQAAYRYAERHCWEHLADRYRAWYDGDHP